jgi:hypothetical protein
MRNKGCHHLRLQLWFGVLLTVAWPVWSKPTWNQQSKDHQRQVDQKAWDAATRREEPPFRRPDNQPTAAIDSLTQKDQHQWRREHTEKALVPVFMFPTPVDVPSGDELIQCFIGQFGMDPRLDPSTKGAVAALKKASTRGYVPEDLAGYFSNTVVANYPGTVVLSLHRACGAHSARGCCWDEFTPVVCLLLV